VIGPRQHRHAAGHVQNVPFAAVREAVDVVEELALLGLGLFARREREGSEGWRYHG
jgi:hypothetical protein